MSELVGIVLLFGLVTVGIGILVLSGTALQDEINDQTRLRTMEVTMSELDAELSTLVYRQNVNLTSLELPDPEDKGRMEVREDVTTVEVSLNGNPDCTERVEMGSIAYVDSSGTELVYEAGAVWRIPSDETGTADPEEVLQVQQPSLQYNGLNVSMTATRIRGEFATTSGIEAEKQVEASVSATNETEYGTLVRRVSGFPDERCWRLSRSDAPAVHDSVEGPLPENVRLYINITSPYHEGWKRHLEREFADDIRSSQGGVVDTDPTDNTVGVVLYYEDVGGFDHDDDGVPNRADNCPYRHNPRQTNSEPSSAPGDPFGDECDPDDDGDGIPDDPKDPDNADFSEVSDTSGEYWRYEGNWTDVGPGAADDTFGNENDDGAEYSTDDYRPGDLGGAKDPEYDPGRVGDRRAGDNCQKEQNPDQLNWDGDTVGNVCEDNSRLWDPDGDGAPVGADNCGVKYYNPSRPDASWVTAAAGNPDKWTDQPNADYQTESNSRYSSTPGLDFAQGDACDPDDDDDGVPDPWCYDGTMSDVKVVPNCPPPGTGYWDRALPDNCPRRPNLAQRNTDGDGTGDHKRGDVCDTDIDNDGYENPEGLDGPTPTPNTTIEDRCPYLGANAGPTGSENATYQGCPDKWEQMKASGTHRRAGTGGTPDGGDYDDDNQRETWKNPPYVWNNPAWDLDADPGPNSVPLRCDSEDTPDRIPDEHEGDPYGLYNDSGYDLDGDGVGPCYPSPPIEYPRPGEGTVGTSAININVVIFEIESSEE